MIWGVRIEGCGALAGAGFQRGESQEVTVFEYLHLVP